MKKAAPGSEDKSSTMSTEEKAAEEGGMSGDDSEGGKEGEAGTVQEEKAPAKATGKSG